MTGASPEAGAARADPRGEAPRIGISRGGLAMLLLIAAGWGALFSYSAVFLAEDIPLRPGPADPRGAARVEAASFELPAELARPVGPALRRRAEAGPALEGPLQPLQPRRVALAGDGAEMPQAGPPTLAAPQGSPASPAAMPAERADYVGVWGPTGAACGARSRRRGFLPATITPDGARAGRTVCSFHDGRRSGNAWVLAAECSDRGRRWSSQVRLLVDGDRLIWTSGKGSATYVRCARRAG
ncbi:peptidase inhibitor family I36 protein [Methylobacterium planeticum]|uniref:Peptidase inhibitor family I36 protein n=1 Tax=Methylobacterium planeticum TaxID=2615211 RepID=A0A6N6MNH1_9HYPH|nr:peptidase inhibitor family I36 protein [Methylobacterium planeticum]